MEALSLSRSLAEKQREKETLKKKNAMSRMGLPLKFFLFTNVHLETYKA